MLSNTYAADFVILVEKNSVSETNFRYFICNINDYILSNYCNSNKPNCILFLCINYIILRTQKIKLNLWEK